MTDQQLQLALAKMLPEKLRAYDCGVCWLTCGISTPHWVAHKYPVKDTEWLHACWLVERGLTRDEYLKFGEFITEKVNSVETAKEACSASWQQRAEALCKVKGIA